MAARERCPPPDAEREGVLVCRDKCCRIRCHHYACPTPLRPDEEAASLTCTNDKDCATLCCVEQVYIPIDDAPLLLVTDTLIIYMEPGNTVPRILRQVRCGGERIRGEGVVCEPDVQ